MGNRNVGFSAHDTKGHQRSAQGAEQADSADLAGDAYDAKHILQESIASLAIVDIYTSGYPTDIHNHTARHDEEHLTPRLRLRHCICRRPQIREHLWQF